MKSALVLCAVLAACGGKKSEPVAPTGGGGGAPVGSCASVTYSCTSPVLGCFEGGDDMKAALGAECTKDGGVEGTKCDPAGTLGHCTITEPGKLTPTFKGCGSMYMKPNEKNPKNADEAKVLCDNFKGTWTPT